MNMRRATILLEIIIVTALVPFSISSAIHSINLREALIKLKMSFQVLSDPSIQANGKSFIGTAFMDINLSDINGQQYTLHLDNAALKVIILFNTTDCPGCLDEYRLWKHVYTTFPHDKVSVIGICNDINPDSIFSFTRQREIDFPVLLDPDNKVRNAMGLRYSPLRIILDRHNVILQIARSGLDRGDQKALIRYLEDILARPSNE